MIVECPDCNNGVSNRAMRCPACGCPEPSKPKGVGSPLAYIFLTPAMILFMIAVASLTFWAMESPNYISVAAATGVWGLMLYRVADALR